MKINVQDLSDNNEIFNFIEMFDKEFSMCGKIYDIGLSCSSYGKYAALLDSWKRSFAEDNIFVIPDSEPQEYPLLWLMIHIPHGNKQSRIKAIINKALNTASTIDPSAIICKQGFRAYEKPFFSSTTKRIKSLHKLQNAFKGNNYIGDLSHPKIVEDEKIYEMTSDNEKLNNITPHDHYILESDLSINSIELTFSINEKNNLLKGSDEISKYLGTKWVREIQKENFTSWARKNELEEIQEVIEIWKSLPEDNTIVDAPLYRDYIKANSPKLFNMLKIDSPSIKLKVSSKHKFNLSLFNADTMNYTEKNIYILGNEYLNRIISICFNFSTK